MKLSGKQRKAADRVGGIELLLLWPPELGPEPDLGEGYEADARPRERQWAQEHVAPAAQAVSCVLVNVRIVCERRPTNLPAGGEVRAHLACIIIGRRWVHATGAPKPVTMWMH